MLLIHSPRCLEYSAAGHPETPDRVRSTVALLHKSNYVWLNPEPCTEADILRVHAPTVLEAVKNGHYFDADTPHFPNIYELACLSAGGAILAAQKAVEGQPAISLMRPPGHHAERGRVMGFCYFNNIAIAAAKLLAEHKLPRVAILDFDCHHGNGTEDIFFGNPQVLFASLHQSPCYPGTGLENRDNCLNFPLPPQTEPAVFLKALEQALEKIRAFQPAVLAVSAGFDAFRHDPITEMALEIETYHEIGSRLAQTGLPTFAVLEGGYARQLAECVEAFVTAW
ncbi:MAG: Histone deacetylase-like amidohydrolase [Verrucomicrobiae bacterium]|nr:Histone deacetylase-like amidohydrolase [Verrucomicrobiae bacterium]